MNSPSSGHEAVSIVVELVSLVQGNTAYQFFVGSSPDLRQLLERAKTVARQAVSVRLEHRAEPMLWCDACQGMHYEPVLVQRVSRTAGGVA
jgi:hypothetical protein